MSHADCHKQTMCDAETLSRSIFSSYHRTSVNFLDVEYEYVNIPRNEIFPLEKCYLEGLKTWCPADGASVLSRTYRSRNLQEPDHHLDYDTGCWVKGKKKGK